MVPLKMYAKEKNGIKIINVISYDNFSKTDNVLCAIEMSYISVTSGKTLLSSPNVTLMYIVQDSVISS